MHLIQTIILGIVEGLTEFLPVSSTGHLILTDFLLGREGSDANKAFDVIIQAGAIFAVIWEYRKLLKQTISGAMQKNVEALSLVFNIFLAFIPAAIIGLIFGKAIKQHLFGVLPVAMALVVGGVVMILIERSSKLKQSSQATTSLKVSRLGALGIGFAQCFALWPGVSRSMSTILGARLTGLGSKSAAEFSFLLAIPTILAASAYDMFKSREILLSGQLNILELVIGSLVSFVTALVVIRAFLKFLGSHSLEAFGWYRIAVGLAFLALV